MFLIKKDKAIYTILFLISVIGIATGMNYQKTISVETIKTLKKSFEFGLYNFFLGTDFLKIYFSMIFSLFKHFIIFSLGMFWWGIYPIVLLNLFGIGFKMGIVLSFVISLLKFNGIMEIISVFIIVFFIVFCAVIYCKNITDNRINMSRYKKIDYKNIKFIVLSASGVVILSFILNFLFFISKNSGLKLYGLFTTFL